MSVALAWPERQEVVELELPENSTVADALTAARIDERYPHPGSLVVGIWSRACERDTRLREGDRVEVYRPLVADAKQMRRARARRRR